MRPRKLTTPSLMALSLSVKRSHRLASIFVSVLMFLPRPKANVSATPPRRVAKPIPPHATNPKTQFKSLVQRGQYGHPCYYYKDTNVILSRCTLHGSK